MLEAAGLTELRIRLPQLILGTLSVVLFPWIVRPLLSKRSTLLFAALLTLSPLLIFYSRLARPYMIVVFLSFICIFSFHGGLRNGQRSRAVL
jgi:predicted membrane-bound mannosyltransferase